MNKLSYLDMYFNFFICKELLQATYCILLQKVSNLFGEKQEPPHIKMLTSNTLT